MRYIFLNLVSVIKIVHQEWSLFYKKIKDELFFVRFSISWNQIVDKIKYGHLEIPNAFENLLKNGQFQN